MSAQSGRVPRKRPAVSITLAWMVPFLLGVGPVWADLGTFYQVGDPDTGDIMPVVGRQTIHTEATSMLADWIRQLTSAPSSLVACPP